MGRNPNNGRKIDVEDLSQIMRLIGKHLSNYSLIEDFLLTPSDLNELHESIRETKTCRASLKAQIKDIKNKITTLNSRIGRSDFHSSLTALTAVCASLNLAIHDFEKHLAERKQYVMSLATRPELKKSIKIIMGTRQKMETAVSETLYLMSISVGGVPTLIKIFNRHPNLTPWNFDKHFEGSALIQRIYRHKKRFYPNG